MYHPYIESATNEEPQEFPGFFCQSAEMDFHRLARPRNVGVDLKYDVLC